MSEVFHPDSGDSDRFDDIIGNFQGSLRDPVIDAIHEEALQCQALVDGSTNESTLALRAGFVKQLDAKWPYYNARVEVVGTGWHVTTDADGDKEIALPVSISRTAVSQGFIYRSPHELSSFASNDQPKIAHLLQLVDEEGTLLDEHAIIPVEDLTTIEPLDPSVEMRERRFRYHHPQEVVRIDELVERARRPDQILRHLGGYRVKINPSDEYGRSQMQDTAAYLFQKADLEPLANYFTKINGMAFVASGAEDEPPRPVLLDNVSVVLAINDVMMGPLDMSQLAEQDVHIMTPYVEATMLLGDDDIEIMMPCASIAQIFSARYWS